MSITKTIGGQRLGSGNKMKTELHGYNRSTHNLGRNWRSSMAPGVLYPCFVEPALNGDTWDIDLEAAVRTIPTIGPLFGSFKLQLDFFSIPIRLYQGILHNNPVNIGMEMSRVLMPQFKVRTTTNPIMNAPMDLSQVAENALIKYLGVSGVGRNANKAQQPNAFVARAFWAVPLLGYYDTFKNYYANKQEANAYVITPKTIISSKAEINTIKIYYQNNTITTDIQTTELYERGMAVEVFGQFLNPENVTIDDNLTIPKSLAELERQGYIQINKTTQENIYFSFNKWESGTIMIETESTKEGLVYDMQLQPFPLENIDQMRKDILSMQTLGQRFIIDKSNHNYLPYKTIVETEANTGITYNAFPMNGLCVKTYQSDMFNNWVNTEWIDGVGGITDITKIDVSGGYLTIDAFNLASKVYNYMNRVAVSGGTYEDWQTVSYDDENVLRHAETPIYCGGMASEVVFEEIIQTADTSVMGEVSKTGSLAGKGTLLGRRGGNLTIKINEPSIIMGIVSITPRIDYTQGNKWFMTELDNMEKLHVPALDGIGFQESMNEQRAWWDVVIAPNSETILSRTSAGKVPAWLNYMSAVDEAYGDFANSNKCQYMILARNYEYDENQGIADLTTYIDPTKYNYAFAYTGIDSQNMWTQIYMKAFARRKMSAKIIPNL